MNTYKDQFTEWSPDYPVFFHSSMGKFSGKDFSALRFTKTGKSILIHTMLSHRETINAINKAMKK